MQADPEVTASSSLADLAIALGRKVFACRSDKAPATPHGFKDATDDPVSIRAQFTHPKAAAIGIPTGQITGLVVLDIDAAGMAWYQANKHRLGQPRVHRTRSGGLHLIYVAPAGTRLKCTASQIALGVDTRGDGGYFVTPPSPGYAVVDPCEPSEMPSWMFEAWPKVEPPPAPPPPPTKKPVIRDGNGSTYALKALRAECEAIRSASFGTQETTLNAAGLKIGQLVAGGELPESTAKAALVEAGITMSSQPGREPWRPTDVRAKVERSLHDGMRQPRSAPELRAVLGGKQQDRPGSAEDAQKLDQETPDPEAARNAPGPATGGDDILTAFNSRFAVVNEHGKAVVYSRITDHARGRDAFERITFEDLEKLYLNRTVQVGTNAQNQPVTQPAAKWWLRHPDRRQYLGGVVFDPSDRHRPDTLNLWTGFACEPIPGDWSLMRNHLLRVICRGNHEHFRYLMGWLALLIQKPGKQGQVAVVLKGLEGVGKGVLGKALKKIIGQHAITISNPRHLVGNFNSHLRDCVFLFADEAFFAGDVKHTSVLKNLITEDTIEIEGKFQNTVEVPNYLHVLMASNEQWVVPASLDARRFFVLLVSPDMRRNFQYFDDLIRQMESGGYEAMHYDLKHYDLTGFDVRDVPETEGLQEQKGLSLPTELAWWRAVLERGYVFESKLGLSSYFGEWHSIVSTQLLYRSYQAFAQDRHERRPMYEGQFGKFIKSLRAQPCRKRHAVVGEEVKDCDTGYGGTTRKASLITPEAPMPSYQFGDLATARAAFCEVTGLPIEDHHLGAPEV